MHPVNDGHPICPLTKYLEEITPDTKLQDGDVLYTEWYGNNADGNGDPRDPNRFRLGVAHNVEQYKGWYSPYGNPYVSEKWYKNLSSLLRAMPMGSGGIASWKKEGKFTRTWKIGHIDAVKKVFGGEFSVPEFMKILVELKFNLEQAGEKRCYCGARATRGNECSDCYWYRR